MLIRVGLGCRWAFVLFAVLLFFGRIGLVGLRRRRFCRGLDGTDFRTLRERDRSLESAPAPLDCQGDALARRAVAQLSQERFEIADGARIQRYDQVLRLQPG